jgi:non-ribosomal peptide synthetase component F
MSEKESLELRRAKLSAIKESLLKKRLQGRLKIHSGPPPIGPRSTKERAPLSFAQQRLWFLGQLEPGTASYNIPKALRLTGHLDVAVLERVLNEIVRRHEALRTRFEIVEEQPVQIISETQPMSLPLIDLSGLAELERATETARLTQEEARRPFDLARGPLVRASLLRTGETEHLLLFTMHHIVSDGWSIGLLIEEVATLYKAFKRGEASPLDELLIQYADYAVWQREWLTAATLSGQFAYWRRQLAGMPTLLKLPTDRPRPPVQTFQGAEQHFVLMETLTAQLKALSQQEGVTLFMTLLAAFKVLLRHYADSDDIVVGTDIANRSRIETERLIGFFVNQLVLRTDLSGDPTFREVVGRVRDVTLGAYEHQDLPFNWLAGELQPKRELSHTPLFQVKIVLQNNPIPTLDLPGLKLDFIETSNGTAKFDLLMNMTEKERHLIGALGYNTDIFEPATIERLLELYKTLLDAAVKQPGARLSVFEAMLTQADEERRMMREQALRESRHQKLKNVRRRVASELALSEKES